MATLTSPSCSSKGGVRVVRIPDDAALPAPRTTPEKSEMNAKHLGSFGLYLVLAVGVLAGGASVVAADIEEWQYFREGGEHTGWRGCYVARYANYQQYPCFFPIRKEHGGCKADEEHPVMRTLHAPTVEDKIDGTLHLSSVKGAMEVVEKLLNAGMNPNATNTYGYAPLHVAAFAGQTAIVEALLKAGADPNVVPAEGASASESTLKYCAGMTPLHFAAHGGHAEVIGALLAAGADANAADGAGVTPMYWSEKAGHVDATISLLTGGGAQ